MAAIALTREFYFTTTSVIDWMDVFTRPIYKHIIVDSLSYCQKNKGNDKKITNFKFWQDDNHVEQLYSYDFYKQKLDYIHMNPVRQEIVEHPEDYIFSSARNYAGMDGLLDVIVSQ